MMGLIMLFPLILFSQDTTWVDGDIAIIQWNDIYPGEDLRGNLIRSVSIKVDEYFLKENPERIAEVLRKVARENYRLILIIGGKFSDEVKRYFPKTSVVIVGSMGNLSEIHRETPTITGVYRFVSMEDQINMIKRLIPDLKKIGVIFNPLESGEQVKMFESALSDTSITIIKNSVSKPKEVGTALHFLRDVDILWLPCDPLFQSSTTTRFILRYSYTDKIPVFTSDWNLVGKGAIAALSPSNFTQESLFILDSIMKGQDISDIEPRFPASDLFLNLKTAKRIGFKIPNELVLEAREAYR